MSRRRSILSSNGVPTVGLVAYYPFNGNANDESGNGNHGTVNGATLTTGRKGDANGSYSFDGNDHINIDSAVDDLQTTTQGTFSLWVNPTDITSPIAQYFLTFGDTDANEYIGLFIRGANLGAVGLVVSSAGSTKVFYSTNNNILNEGQWNHVVVAQNGSIPFCYINGLSVPFSDIASTVHGAWFSGSSGIDNGRIGTLRFNNDIENFYFEGSMDDIRTYNRVLTEPEITLLANE